jgi:hypothetical protein
LTTTFIGEEEKNREFLAHFDDERLNRVHIKVEQARDKAKHFTEKLSLGGPEAWDWYPIECPVCGSDGVLTGETTAETEYDHHGVGDLSLTFVGETFKCEQCGLILEDYEELCIARIDPDVDRSDEADQWSEENFGDDYERW